MIGQIQAYNLLGVLIALIYGLFNSFALRNHGSETSRRFVRQAVIMPLKYIRPEIEYIIIRSRYKFFELLKYFFCVALEYGIIFKYKNTV